MFHFFSLFFDSKCKCNTFSEKTKARKLCYNIYAVFSSYTDTEYLKKRPTKNIYEVKETATAQRFQKFGVKISKTVKISSLPTSIANDINHFAKAGSDW